MSTKLNCIIVDDEPVAREILATYIEKTPNLHLIASYQNALEVIQATHDHSIDIYFLDINMPEITGLSLAKILGNSAHIRLAPSSGASDRRTSTYASSDRLSMCSGKLDWARKDFE